MIQYCTPLKQIIDRQTTHRGPSRQPVALSVAYHTLPRSYQAAVRDLRVEAVSITASATVWFCHHDTHPYSFINSGQAHAVPCVPVEAHLRLASARLLLGLNKDYSSISLLSQLIKWCQLRG